MRKARTLRDWIFNPTEEELVCKNNFHDTVRQVFEGAIPGVRANVLMDQTGSYVGQMLDPDSISVKVAQLMKNKLVLLGGDVIYVREGSRLHTLGDSIDLLSYYLHTDSRDARRAADLLETNFQGYFPIIDNNVAKNVIRLHDQYGGRSDVDLKTLEIINDVANYPEYGEHLISFENVEALRQFFDVLNDAIGEPYFFEKTMMYHFNQPYREKSHVLVGGGGNGKSMFMGLVHRLYEDFALTDAPQPNFTGHAAAVIAYSFIGKRVVTFNDVGDPSAKFLEWLKRMITGNLEVKTPTGSWLSVPCNTNFMMETNYVPQILALEAHRRRFIIRSFPEDFRLKDHLSDELLDRLGDRGDITAGDIAYYMLTITDKVSDWAHFGTEPEVETEEEK